MEEKSWFLAKNIREFYCEGNNALKRNSFNSATSLFFKALAVLADLYILQKEGFIPKNHTDRFQILRQRQPGIYSVLDGAFPAYQESYTIALTKEDAEALKDDVKRVAKKIGFKLD